MKRVEGKVAIVTGAGQGLGRAIAEALAREGAAVVATDIDGPAAQATAHDIVKAGGAAHGVTHDAIDPAGWDAVMTFTRATFGRLDVLVNNAGGGTFADLETMTLAEWRRVVGLNLDSTFLGTQGAIALMTHSGGGSIVNISSVAGLVGSPTLPAYSAAKGGIRLFSKTAALYCAQRGYGIRVNSVHPGLVRTRSGLEMASKAFGVDEVEAERMMAAMHPLGRIGEPSEIANAVLFLASDESSFVTGAEYAVDGGYTAG